MDADEFANRVISKVTSQNPPQYLTLGGAVRVWNLLKWLSRTTAEAIIWREVLTMPLMDLSKLVIF